MSLFDTIFYQPLLNVLILFYQYFSWKNFGIAIILLTILIRILLYPLGAKAIKSQKAFQDLQPKIKEIQKKYKEDKEKLLQETLALYREAKISPFSGFLPLLIQLPILFALYKVFWKGLSAGEFSHLYSFIQKPEAISPFFVGSISLDKPSFLLAILAGVLQFFQMNMMNPKTKTGENLNKIDKVSTVMQKQMLLFFPFLIIIMLIRTPSAISLYWIVTTIFSIIQQYLILRTHAE